MGTQYEEGVVGVHIVPTSEDKDHTYGVEGCRCDPDVQYLDEDTGLPYPYGPLVTHNCFVGTPPHEQTLKQHTILARLVARRQDHDEDEDADERWGVS